jgi:hypothetical protein
MHIVCSHAYGYETYIKAYRCDDKQGEIARQAVRIGELEYEVKRLREFCQTLEETLLAEGDPFCGDDWELMQRVRFALGKIQELPT